MPIYEYTCNDCGSEFELLIRGEEKPACPSCGQARLTKSLSVPAAHTTGSRDPACPAKDTCGMPHCCGNNCGMADWR
jgi:putative FmdB family regulatory protein